jgi:hypothetical protein
MMMVVDADVIETSHFVKATLRNQIIAIWQNVSLKK